MPKQLLPITTIHIKTLTPRLMNYIFSLIFLTLLMLGTQSCDKAPQAPPLVILPDSLHEGIYVLNEGNFQSGNATFDFIDVFNNVYYSDVFKQANNKATKQHLILSTHQPTKHNQATNQPTEPTSKPPMNQATNQPTLPPPLQTTASCVK
jgi:hypothetical protein